MKKLLTALLCATMLLGLGGCGDNGSKDAPKEKEFIDDNKLSDLYSTPKDFKGKYVNLTGRVFKDPETKDDMVAFQMWQDPNNNNTVVVTTKELAKDLASDDYIKLTGYVEGEYSGKNMLGGTVTAPQIVAEEIEKVSYADVVSPTIKTVDVNETKESNGVKVTLSKVEFAKNETRVYLTIKNDSPDKYSFYDFNAKIIQGDKQYAFEGNYEVHYDEIESDIPSGVKEEGILTFKNIEEKDFKMICEGHSDNFTFEISVK